MSAIDYPALAARAFDFALESDEQDALRVWADLLGGQGDPRGTLIAIEHAIAAQPERRRELQRAMLDHLAAEGAALVGDFAPVLAGKRTVALEWRAGALYGATLDTRYAVEQFDQTAPALAMRLLGAPAAATLRRLHVRVRKARDVAPVVDAIVAWPRPIPLEQLLVLASVAPTGVERTPIARGGGLVDRFPDLWLYAHDTEIAPLAPIGELDPAGAPEDLADRAELGRALIAVESRAAALARITALGPRAFVYYETLVLLLHPAMASDQGAIIRAIQALAGYGLPAKPLLARITGRVEHYDVATRRAAGLALATMR